MLQKGTSEHGSGTQDETAFSLTNVKDPLLCCVLPRMPVLPMLQLFVAVFILAEHNHDHTLERPQKNLKMVDGVDQA